LAFPTRYASGLLEKDQLSVSGAFEVSMCPRWKLAVDLRPLQRK